MFFFVMMLLKYKSFIGNSYFKNKKIKKIVHQDDGFKTDEQRPLTKYSLNKEEINDFYLSLDRLCTVNFGMLRNMLRLQYRVIISDSYMDHMPSTSVFVNIIRNLTYVRENAECDRVCEYEFIKFYELYYHSIWYIKSYYPHLLFDFIKSSTTSIFPILSELQFSMKYYKCFKYIYLLIAKFQSAEERSDERRRSTLIYFLSEFIEKYFNETPNKLIDSNRSTKELNSLCSNIFVKFYLTVPLMPSKIKPNFQARKYPISKSYEDFLFYEGNIADLIYSARIELKKYLDAHNITVEKQLLSEKLIPPLFDRLNEHASSLNLSQIGYPRDDNGLIAD